MARAAEVLPFYWFVDFDFFKLFGCVKALDHVFIEGLRVYGGFTTLVKGQFNSRPRGFNFKIFQIP
jgi:hypothetical protein